ncbi:MAG: hypothetical protein LBK02_01545, partial [Treponema sp.]|nr:hypothetical protein [Treponema sp.]
TEAAQQGWIAEIAPQIPAEERQTAYEVAGFLARARGETAEQWGRRITFTNIPPAKIEGIIEAAQRNRKIVKGATFGLKDIAGKTQRYIYLSRNADFSTLNHELFHDHIRSLSEEQRAEWEEALGIEDGDWDAKRFESKTRRKGEKINAHEYAAEAFEDYLTQRKEPPSAKLKELFDRIIGFMRRIYGTLRDMNGIKPELKKKFDELFSGEEGTGAGTSPGGTRIDQNGPEGQNAVMATAGYDEQINQRIDELNREGRERVEEISREEGVSGEPVEEVIFQEGKSPVDTLVNEAQAITNEAERDKVIRELRELERLYPPETNQYAAPNGKPSLLLEELGEEVGRRAWYAVRTSSFKEWFGDWERAARIEGINNIVPADIKLGNHINKKEVEIKSEKFGLLENIHDERIAEFPIGSIGKIINNKGFDVSRIIDDLPKLYKESLLAWSEPEIKKEGHKFHPNISEYHQYVNKFTDGTDEYFIRFTITETKAKTKSARKNLIHSTAISDVSIYKNGDDSQRIRGINPGEAKTSPFIDLKLQQFFDSVNPSDISQVRDANGEPKPVFHGTGAEFDVFDRGRIGEKTGKKASLRRTDSLNIAYFSISIRSTT